MTTEEMIERAKEFGITVEQKGTYGLYHLDWKYPGGSGFTAIPERSLESTLTRTAKDQAKYYPEMAAKLPFVQEVFKVYFDPDSYLPVVAGESLTPEE